MQNTLWSVALTHQATVTTFLRYSLPIQFADVAQLETRFLIELNPMSGAFLVAPNIYQVSIHNFCFS